MKKLGRKPKQAANERHPRIPQRTKQQQAYHYSAKRSNAEKSFDRSMSDDSQAKHTSSTSLLESVLPMISVVFVLLGLLYMSTLSTGAQISSPEGVEVPDEAKLQMRADELLGSSIMNRSKLTINTDKLEQQLANDFPELKEVQVSLSIIRHKPMIWVDVASPAVAIISANNQFVIGDDGTVLYKVADDKRNGLRDLDLPVIQDQSSFDIQVGKQALTEAQIAYITEVIFQLEQKGITPESLIIKGGGGELQVRPAGERYFVRFNFFEDARKSAGTFLAVKEELQGDDQITEYVDVRVPERAYIK